jgi:hypothetical protein
MRIRTSIYYTAMLTLFVAAPVLAVESISQIQSLQGQVWVERSNERIEANSGSEIYSGDLVSTSDTGRLGTRLWSQVNLKLDANSKIMIVSVASLKGKDSSLNQKMMKLEYGASCIEINDILDLPVFFQIGDRVTIKFINPVELCLSTDAVKSHIKLSKGSAKLMHLSDSIVIALNEAESEISFFNGGIFSLLSPSRAPPLIINTEDPKTFAKSEVLK